MPSDPGVLETFIFLPMRCLFFSCAVFLAGCTGQNLTDRPLLANDTQPDQSQVVYPPKTLPENTFVVSTPLTYQAKRAASSSDTAAAQNAVGRLAEFSGKARYLAVPVAAHQGRTTTADIMVYDRSQQQLLADTVYQIAYTPASGQTLNLDGITAVFELPPRR